MAAAAIATEKAGTLADSQSSGVIQAANRRGGARSEIIHLFSEFHQSVERSQGQRRPMWGEKLLYVIWNSE